jgi:type II secretory pathway pseudopilin PulG
MPNPQQQGFVYVAMLFALAIFGLGLAKLGQWTSVQERRDREAELLRTGQQVIEAIRQYYVRSPGTAHRFPRTFADLTEDTRYIGTVRYLRTAPLDPITQSAQWGYVRTPDGGFAGVYSLSGAAPLARRALDVAGTRLPAANRYSDWRFVYEPANDQTLPLR